MNCPQCNFDAPDTNYKCPNCGRILQPDVQPSDFRNVSEKKSSVNPNIVVAVIGVILFAVFIYVAVFKGKSDTHRTDSGGVTEISDTSEPSGENDSESSGYNSHYSPPPPQFETPSDSSEPSEGTDSGLSSTSSSTSSPSASSDSHQPGEVINGNNPGETFTIGNYVKKGKMTIFDFYSEYCPPCRKMGPMLKELDEKRGDIVVFKIDINRPEVNGIDWQSPIARQYNLGSIPHFIIFNASGDKEAEGRDAFQKIMELLNRENIQ